MKPGLEIHVGGQRQLLFDDFFLSTWLSENQDWTTGIRWSVGRVEKSEPLMIADKPWEMGIAWLSPLREGGMYRLWYNTILPAEKYKVDNLRVCYAESSDGLEWHKPALGVMPWNGSTSNNLVYAGSPYSISCELGAVFADPSAPPNARYKLVGSELFPIPSSGTIWGACSGDGIHWTACDQPVLARYADNVGSAAYDPVQGNYVAYIRRYLNTGYGELLVGDHPVRGAWRGRAISRIESENFRQWSYPELVVAPDLEDGLDTDLHLGAYCRYEGAENAHFMFISMVRHRKSQPGISDVQVAVSRDNRHWIRPTRQPLIVHGPVGSFDESRVDPAPGFVWIGEDHLALYIRNEGFPADREPSGGHPLGGAMSRVVMRRDRIVGIEAGPEGGSICTRPLIFSGRRLLLNLEPTGADAQLRVQILSPAPGGKGPVPSAFSGYSLDDCVPLTQDELDAVVRWEGGAEVGRWAGQPVRLQVHLRSMRLYAFQFSD